MLLPEYPIGRTKLGANEESGLLWVNFKQADVGFSSCDSKYPLARTFRLSLISILIDKFVMSDDEQGKRSLCSQCGQRGAVYRIGTEPVCIPCEHIFQQSRYMQFAQNAAMLNHAAEELDAVAGFGLPSPRVQIPNAPVPPLYFNNQHVTVSGGTVGAINMDTARDIQVNLETITQNGDLGVADKLADLTNAILNADVADDRAKNDLLEQVAYLTQQASAKPAERKPGAIKAIIAGIKDGAAAISSVAGAWSAVEPLLKAFIPLTHVQHSSNQNA